jgi:hypothetical protein
MYIVYISFSNFCISTSILGQPQRSHQQCPIAFGTRNLVFLFLEVRMHLTSKQSRRLIPTDGLREAFVGVVYTYLFCMSGEAAFFGRFLVPFVASHK